MRAISWVLLAFCTLMLLILPLWWPDDLARAKVSPFLWYTANNLKHINYPAIFALFCALLLVGSQATDKFLMTREFKGLVSDRQFVEAYADVIENCLKTMHAAGEMDEAQLVHARRQILHGIRLVVHHYYNKAEKLEINACYMVAYPVTKLPAGVEAKIKFKDRKRLLNTYGHVLELEMSAEDHPDLPRDFAIPVEDPLDRNMAHRLLPGAPTAFAKNIVCVVDDTDRLRHYFDHDGSHVDREVVKEELDFFDQQRFKSFASLPIEHEGILKGVLNLQSAQTNIFGRNHRDQEVVTKLLSPLKTALGVLI